MLEGLRKDITQGLFRLSLDWILRSILQISDTVTSSLMDITKAVVKTFFPGDNVDDKFTHVVFHSIHQDLRKSLVKIFPDALPSQLTNKKISEEEWRLKVRLSFICFV